MYGDELKLLINQFMSSIVFDYPELTLLHRISVSTVVSILCHPPAPITLSNAFAHINCALSHHSTAHTHTYTHMLDTQIAYKKADKPLFMIYTTISTHPWLERTHTCTTVHHHICAFKCAREQTNQRPPNHPRPPPRRF